MPSDNVKFFVFIILFIFAVTVLFVLINNFQFIADNALWIIPILIILFLFARFDYLLTLKDYERAVVFRFGKVKRVAGPGWAVIIPPLESAVIVDTRTRTIDIPKQDIVTEDNVEVTIDAVVYLRVRKDNASVINSVIEVVDYIEASEHFVIGLIRDKAGSLTLAELISSIEELNKDLRVELERLAQKWGIQIEEVAIKDIQIPKTVISAMHEQKAAVQKKLARMEGAKAKQAEIEAVKAATMELNDKSLAYYYIQALEKLGEGKSTKFIFPMELTKLASSLSSKNMSPEELEALMKQYAPAIKAFLKKKN
ncbi:MAG: SPFH domain-containing protein [archaeon]|nr:SPFH domain-containing protein [archaeon]